MTEPLPGLRSSDRYLTPDWHLAAEYEYWAHGIDLDPFWDPKGRVKCRQRLDAHSSGEDAYMELDECLLADCDIRSIHINGPYSNKSPARTARLVYNLHRHEPYLETVNICPAAVGSNYWREHVWPLQHIREGGGGLVVAYLGRLPFEAAVDVRNAKGELVCGEGLTQEGNRTEIATVACVARPELLARLLEKHSPRKMTVHVYR